MVRFKFLVFTVVVVCAWVAQLVLSAPVHSEAAVNDGLRTAELAGKAALARRGAAAALVERVGFAAGAPDTLSVPRGAKLPPAERLTQLRDNLSKALSSETRSELGELGEHFLFGFASAEGAVWARGVDGDIQSDVAKVAPSAGEPGEAAAASPTVDVASLAKLGRSAKTAAALDTTYSVLSLPVFEKGSPEPLGNLVIGAPIAQTALAGANIPMALIEGDNVQGIGGVSADSKVQVKQWLGALGSAEKGVIERNAVDQLGPVFLPFFTAGDAKGGKAARTVAVRQSLDGTEIVAFAPVDLSALAAEQKKSLMTLAGLLVFALVWTLLMGSGARAGGKSNKKAEAETPAEPVTATAAQQVVAEAPSSQPAAEPAFAAAEATPEDFQFGASPSASDEPAFAEQNSGSGAEPFADDSSQEEATGSFQQEPSEGFAAAEPEAGASNEASAEAGDFPFPPPPPAPPPTRQDYDSPGVAGSLHTPAHVDPSAYVYAAPAAFPEDDNPEATRVATVPAELLAAAAHAGGNSEDLATLRGPSAGLLQSSAPSIAAAAGNTDDAHFQEVFREFIETRERCGETPDALTFEKFAAKLRKNKDQLMLKHNCKTVRFQVYVKEGKAALKATPVAR